MKVPVLGQAEQIVSMAACKQIASNELEIITSCDLCGSSEFQPELLVNDWKLMRCKICKLVFTSPRYTADYLKRMYECRYYESAPGYLQAQLEEPAEDIYRVAKSSMKLWGSKIKRRNLRSLDVGCGGGYVVSAFKKAGWEAVGIDLNEKATDAGKIMGLDLRTESIQSPALGAFNIITAFHILEHTTSPRAFLYCCYDRLGKNGYIIIEVPNYGSSRSRKMGQNWPNLYPDHHLYQFTIQTIERYLRATGFKIIRIQKVQGRGPFENSGSRGRDKTGVLNKVKNVLFEFRRLVYWVPGARDLSRHIIWQMLGYGEFIRVLSQKIES